MNCPMLANATQIGREERPDLIVGGSSVCPMEVPKTARIDRATN